MGVLDILDEQFMKWRNNEGVSEEDKKRCLEAFAVYYKELSQRNGTENNTGFSEQDRTDFYLNAVKMTAVGITEHSGWPFKSCVRLSVLNSLKRRIREKEDPWVIFCSIFSALGSNDLSHAVESYNKLKKTDSHLAQTVPLWVQFANTYCIDIDLGLKRQFLCDIAPLVTTNAKGLVVFASGDELMSMFDAEYRSVPFRCLFEQGGFLSKTTEGWEIALPAKVLRLEKVAHDVSTFDDIKSGFLAMNKKGEYGILVTLSKQAAQKAFFINANEIILHGSQGFFEVILTLKPAEAPADFDTWKFITMLRQSPKVTQEIDNATGEVTDEFKYVPLPLEIEALCAPQEIIYSLNWRKKYRTNQYLHTRFPSQTRWNDLVREIVKDNLNELNTPREILALRAAIVELNAPRGAFTSVGSFWSNATPRNLRTLLLDLLIPQEQERMFFLADKYKDALAKKTEDFYKEELREIVEFFLLVQKGTVLGLPDRL